MTTRHNATVQFPSRADHQRLKALSLFLGKPIGVVVKELADEDATRLGLKIGTWDRTEPPPKHKVG